MTSLIQMISVNEDVVKNATHLDLLNAIGEIDHGATNWLHGENAQSKLHGSLNNVRNALSDELSSRLGIKRVKLFPSAYQEQQQVDGRNIYEVCKELDESD